MRCTRARRAGPGFAASSQIGARELERALHDDLYTEGYYGEAGGSVVALDIGTAEYTRTATHADEGAYLVWRFLPVQRTLDVGCAFGFFVEAERELGLDATGVDVSQYALDHAAFGARGHVRYGNLLHRLPYGRGAFEGVSLFETLEHLPPEVVPRALREVRRMTTKYVIAHDPVVRTEPERSRRLVRREGPARAPRPLPRRSATPTTARSRTTISTATPTARRWKAISPSRRSHGGPASSKPPGFVRDGDDRAPDPSAPRAPRPHEVLEPLRVPRTRCGRPGASSAPRAEIADVEKRFGFDERVAAPEDLAGSTRHRSAPSGP